MHKLNLSIFVLLLGIAITPSVRADWPQFRGPDSRGHASVEQLPLKWSETKNVRWKTPISGKGWSSPVIAGNRIWMTTALEKGRSLRAVCLHQDSGKLLHDVEVFTPEDPVPVNTKNSYASPTPVIGNGRVYVHFGTMGTAALSSKTGEVLWRNTKLQLKHKEGPGGSPILFRNLLIVNCDGMDVQYVVALDISSGEIVWKTERSAPFREKPDFRKAYSTPLIIEHEGKAQLVSPGADQVQGYDPLTGEELWRVRYRGFSNVPQPLFRKGKVFVCTGFTKPQLWAIRLGGKGDVTETHVDWRFKRQVPARSSPILVDNRIYMVSDRGVGTCLDADSGKTVWQKRIGGNYSASPIYAGGHIYFCSEEGKVTVMPNGEKSEAVAVNEMGGQLMATPAVDDGALFLRTESHLYRIEASGRRVTSTGKEQ